MDNLDRDLFFDFFHLDFSIYREGLLFWFKGNFSQYDYEGLKKIEKMKVYVKECNFSKKEQLLKILNGIRGGMLEVRDLQKRNINFSLDDGKVKFFLLKLEKEYLTLRDDWSDYLEMKNNIVKYFDIVEKSIKL